jgi:exonuclease SbcD
MLTGACFSSGQTAIGEDLEFGLNDLHAAKASYTALGHVHKYQAFPSNVVYSGSPARLNFGEQEEKGFVIAEFDGARCADIRFIKTPARTFCFGEAVWESHAQILEAARDLAKGCAGSDVRFRFDIPDEDRGTINRAELEQIFAVAGADKVKVEISVIPKVRTRAAGISRIALLPEKVQRWGDTVREVIPENVLATSGIIEGVSADELLASALASISAPVIPAAVSVVESHLSGVHAACDRYLDPKSDQLGLFR